MSPIYQLVVLILTLFAGGERYSELRRAARCIRDIYYRGCPGKTAGAIYVGPRRKTRFGIRLYSAQQWRRAWSLAIVRTAVDSPRATALAAAFTAYILITEVRNYV